MGYLFLFLKITEGKTIMKKLLIAVVGLSLMFAYGCSSDDVKKSAEETKEVTIEAKDKAVETSSKAVTATKEAAETTKKKPAIEGC